MDDVAAMELAFTLAAEGRAVGERTVGAVIVRGDEIVARRHDEIATRSDPTAHALVLALSDAAASIGDWRLEAFTAAVTLEPCVLCAGAAVQARLGRLLVARADPRAGAVESLYRIGRDGRLNHTIEVVMPLLPEQAALFEDPS